MKAIQSYASQFTSDAAHSERTYINRGDFLESIEIRARYYGYLSGCRYAEPFHSQELLRDLQRRTGYLHGIQIYRSKNQ